MGEHPTREIIDDLDALLGALPPEIVAALHALPDRTALIEVVLDLGRVPEARFPDSEVTLLDREVTEADIALVVDKIGSFGDDNRAGIERTLHRISAIRNRAGKIVGLTCRVGRAVYGTIEIISDFIDSGKSSVKFPAPCSGCARSRATGTPSFTATASAGVSFPELLDRLIALALIIQGAAQPDAQGGFINALQCFLSIVPVNFNITGTSHCRSKYRNIK